MKISDSSGSAIKLLILVSLVLVFGSVYVKSVPYYLRSPALWALHWVSIMIVFIAIVTLCYILLDIFVIDHGSGFERNL